LKLLVQNIQQQIKYEGHLLPNGTKSLSPLVSYLKTRVTPHRLLLG